MKIGIIIGRIGDVDGVALETEKWIEVLESQGHEIFILAGRFKKEVVKRERQDLFRALSFFSPECEWEQHRAFFYPPDDPRELLTHLDYHANRVAGAIFKFVLTYEIDALLVQNASALPCHLSMGMGIRRAVENMGIPTVTHDHDFHWERGSRYHSPFEEITEIVEGTFPLQIPNVRHAVINTPAKEILENKFNMDVTLVPNVMDFSRTYAQKDDYNHDLLEAIGLSKDDIPLFQITRIVERKGIEVAIDLISRLKDKKVKLVITGSAADDERKGYYFQLVEMIEKKNLKDRVIFAHHKILSDRDTTHKGGKIYSLSDAYAHAAACTYFSTYEGFGNAFVEAILARKAIFVNNYLPVYWPDIGSKGFKTVQLEDNNLTDEAVEQIDTIIHDKALRKELTDVNYALGKEHFSYKVLGNILEKLFTF